MLAPDTLALCISGVPFGKLRVFEFSVLFNIKETAIWARYVVSTDMAMQDLKT